jgi:membrane-bound serine protease (ClpP class)
MRLRKTTRGDPGPLFLLHKNAGAPKFSYLKYILILSFLLPLLLTHLTLAAGPVLVVEVKGAITPASDDIFAAALEEAEAEGCQAVVMTLNTPGGGLAETMNILEQMEGTELPIIGYVSPEGATSWSAGTILLLSSDVAAMAPHTIIGSAQPVKLSPTGETEPINDSKTQNAIVALIEEKARKHGRNVSASREFVLSNLNLNAEEAKKYGVIEYISPSLQDLLEQINGSTAKNVTLLTAGEKTIPFQPPANLQFLAAISDPMIAGILLLVGLYALIFGLSSPGAGAEIFGVIALSLGLIGLGFNLNLGALFLVLLGLGLILAELHSHSFGILAAAGLICVMAGSILLIPTSYPQWYLPGQYQRSMAAAFLLPSLIMGGFLAFAIYKVARARLAPTVVGRFEEEEAVALDRLDPRGYVQFHGEYWQAESDQPVEPGQRVVIVEKRGTVLRVRRR